MFYSTLHLTVRYTIHYLTSYSTLNLTVRYTLQYVIPYSTLHLTERYTLQYVIPYRTLYLTVRYTLYDLTPFTTLYLTLPYDPQVLQHNRKLSESPLTRMLRHWKSYCLCNKLKAKAERHSYLETSSTEHVTAITSSFTLHSIHLALPHCPVCDKVTRVWAGSAGFDPLTAMFSAGADWTLWQLAMRARYKKIK